MVTARNQDEKRLLEIMTERGYPGSVKQTMIGMVRSAENTERMTREAFLILETTQEAKMVVKKMQPYLKK